MNENSVVLYESAGHVVIATGIKQKSINGKVGAGAIQIWILNRTVNPVSGVMTGADHAVCGDCPLRGSMRNRACYVNVARAPMNIWRAYQAGHYRHLDVNDYAGVFSGRFVRFGAYGEPVLIPFKLLEAIANCASGFTGYTHQWRNPFLSAYKRYLMASCSGADYEQAVSMGWRAFVVSEKQVNGLMVCPASKEFEAARGRKLTCEQCGQCAGLSRTGRSVQIRPHGQNIAQRTATIA